MPKVSVISIARSAGDFAALRDALDRQTLQDFEFVGEAGGTIPEAWNRAIDRASGDIFVFTETDAQPVYDTWLEDLVNSVPDDRTVVKGLEVTATPWDLSNLACHRNVMAGISFDERFRWAEDTELLCRLKEMGYRLQHVSTAPVIHLRKMRSKRLIRRAFRYGVYQARLRHRYGDAGMVAGVEDAGKRLIAAVLGLAGLAIGYIVFLPERWRRNRRTSGARSE